MNDPRTISDNMCNPPTTSVQSLNDAFSNDHIIHKSGPHLMSTRCLLQMLARCGVETAFHFVRTNMEKGTDELQQHSDRAYGT